MHIFKVHILISFDICMYMFFNTERLPEKTWNILKTVRR